MRTYIKGSVMNATMCPELDTDKKYGVHDSFGVVGKSSDCTTIS